MDRIELREEDWIEEEIKRALQNVSIDEENELIDNAEQEHTPRCLSDQAAVTNDSVNVSSSSQADVAKLFNSYLTSLHTQHTHTQSLMSDVQSTLEHVHTDSQQKGDDVIVNKQKPQQPVTGHSDAVVTMATVKQEHKAQISTDMEDGQFDILSGVDVECSEDIQTALKEVQLNQLIYEEQLTREQIEMEAALNAKIQENKRRKFEQAKIIAEREAAKRDKELKACLLLQAHTRGYLARKIYKIQLNLERTRRAKEASQLTQAALMIQRHTRGMLIRREYDVKLEAAKTKRILAQQMKKRTKAAIVIQSVWRGQSCRRKLVPVLLAAVKTDTSLADEALVEVGTDKTSSSTHIDNDTRTKTGSHGNILTENETTAQCLEGNGIHGNSTCAPLHESKETTRQSPGKLTMSKRIYSALKLLQQQQPGEQLSCHSMDHLPDSKEDVSSLERTTAAIRQSRSSSLPLPSNEPLLQEPLSGKISPSRGGSSLDNSVNDTTTLPSSLTDSALEMKVKHSSSVVSMLANSLSTSKRKALITKLQDDLTCTSHEQQTPTVKQPCTVTANKDTVNNDHTNTLKHHGSTQEEGRSHTLVQITDETSHRQRDQDDSNMMADINEAESSLEAEERAMNELAESRIREELMAQLSRERMNSMLSSDEIAEVAKRKRAHSTYRHELDHASSPLLPNAWLGLIKEQLGVWQMTHRKWMEPSLKPSKTAKSHSGNLKCRSTITALPVESGILRSKSFSPSHATPIKVLSNAQLLAASPKGTKLDDVTQVLLYRPRAPIDLSSFSKCPNLCSLSLNNCGVVTMEMLEGCDQLMELSMQSNMMEHVDCNNLCQLKFADFSNNRIASIHGYDNCSCLLELNLSENRIARVAATCVRGCHSLQRLNLDGNLLINCKGIEHLPLLQHLSCCENHLPKVEGLEQCSLLQSLQLNQNNLQQIPRLPDHVLLRELYLNENSLSSIEPITQAWLPLLQTLSLANNCIVQMDALACLVMLQTLDVQNNTIYDLPVLLQSLRGCFKLKCLCIHGNPVTEEPKFKMYLVKALPHLMTLDDTTLKKTKSSKMELPEVISSCPVVQVCSRQITEQDNLKETQQKELDELVQTNNVNPSPSNTLKILQMKVAHCHDYQKLLIQHLREHETLPFGRNADPPSPTKQPSRFAQKKAAILIQSVWKGHRVRRWYHREIRTRHQAATVIQAHYRGYILRKRLREVLDNAHFSDTESEMEEHVDGIDYNEEIPTDYLDESLLNFDLQPLSPTDAQLDRYTEQEFSKVELINEGNIVQQDTPIFLPAYTLPGGVDDVITYEEWKSQNQTNKSNPSIIHKPTTFVKPSNVAHVDLNSAAEYLVPEQDINHGSHSHTGLGNHRPSKGVQLAWISTNEQTDQAGCDEEVFQQAYNLPTTLSHSGWALNGSDEEFQTDIRTKGESTAEIVADGTIMPSTESNDSHRHGNSKAVPLSEVKAIRNEWGFKSSTTADLMMKRAQRQRKLKNTALKRKRLEDPIERLAVFKKQGVPVDLRNNLWEGSHTTGVHYSIPDLDGGTQSDKNKLVYQWVHNRRLVHSDSDGCHSNEIRGKMKPYHHEQTRSLSNTSLLPDMEPHVLAGHTPRLVSSDAQNQLVQQGACGDGRKLEHRYFELNKH